MGNPKVHRPGDAPPAAADAGNGILARCGSASIGAGMRQLPPAGPNELTRDRAVVVDVPAIGPVRIRYQLSSYKHGRSRFWHWVAVHAEAV